MGAVVCISVVGVLPLFLTGALAIQVQNEMGFSNARLGLAITAFFVATAATAALVGRFVDRLGWRRSAALSIVFSLVSLCGIGLWASRWHELVLLLIVGGMSQAFSSPASNLAIHDAVPRRFHGLATGVKQASVPGAVMLAGVAVPTLGVSVGWRPAFLLGIVLPVVGAGLLWGTRSQRRSAGAVEPPVPAARPAVGIGIVTLAVAAGLGSGAASALASFYVVSAVAAGHSVARSGTMLAISSASVLLVRIALGWGVDKRDTDGLTIISLLLGVGAVGYLLLASLQLGLFFVGGLLAFVAGWGWPGLVQFAVITRSTLQPAAATGVTQTGMALGAATGPASFGLMAEHYSLRTGWSVLAVAAMAAAVFALASRAPREARDHPSPGDPLDAAEGPPIDCQTDR